MTVQEIQKIIQEKVTGVWVPEHDTKGHHYRNTKDGRLVDSVTTQNIIDKPNLVKWAARIAAEWLAERIPLYCKENHEQMMTDASLAHITIRDTAGSIGNLAHDLIEIYENEWIAKGVRQNLTVDNLKEIYIKEQEAQGKVCLLSMDKELDPRIVAAVRSSIKFFDKYPEITPIASELLVGSSKLRGAGTLDLLVLWGDKLWLLDHKTSNSALHDDYAIQVSAYKAFFEEMTGLKIAGCSILGLSKNYDETKVYDIPYLNQAYATFKNQNKIYEWQKNGRKKLIERKNRLKI
jgi:hypothetical protein